MYANEEAKQECSADLFLGGVHQYRFELIKTCVDSLASSLLHQRLVALKKAFAAKKAFTTQLISLQSNDYDYSADMCSFGTFLRPWSTLPI